jgi:hypothetical protein
MARTEEQQRAFDEAQQDEKFQSWVAMNESVLELEFDDDVPDLPGRPWDERALDIAEAAALRLFDSPEDTFSDGKAESAWRFVRFIGETFVEAFEGRWVNLPAGKGTRQRVGVELPFRTMYLEPINLLTSAMGRRTGTEWSTVFRYAEEDYAAYREGGKPA